MSAIILDTETTGTDESAEVIELAWSDPILAPGYGLESVPVWVNRYSCSKPISLGAMAAHHIIEADLEGRDRFSGFAPGASVDYLIGHNIDFDWRVLGRPDIRRICTLALARAHWPEIDSHSLGALIYHIHADKGVARFHVKDAHSARADVRMVCLLLERLIDVHAPATWEELWNVSEGARIPKVMSFGKHKGMKIADVPRDYKRWLLNQPDVDPYLAQALRA